MSTSDTSTRDVDAQPGHKRKRVKLACDYCTTKRQRCTGDRPCKNCATHNVVCSYDTPRQRNYPNYSPPRRATSDSVNLVTPSPQTVDSGLHLQRDRGAVPDTLAPESTVQSVAATVERKHLVQYCGPSSAHTFVGEAWQGLPDHDVHPPHPSDKDEDVVGGTSIFDFGDRHVSEPDYAGFEYPHPAAAREYISRYFDFNAPTYRFLHRGTIGEVVSRLQNPRQHHLPEAEKVPAAAQAVVLMIFATASTYQQDANGSIRHAGTHEQRQSGMYFAYAQHLMGHEAGIPSLASAQARFLMVLYLLSSSRPNKAWFTFGVTTQLIVTLGMHRKRPSTGADPIEEQCRRRLFWCSYVVDKYLSIMLGRPRLLRDDDMDQEMPDCIDDERLTSGKPRSLDTDCEMSGALAHMRLAEILSCAVQEQYSIRPRSDAERLQSSIRRIKEIDIWYSQLPAFMSSSVSLKTLSQLYRRQHTVLQLAHRHALMFITRPLLLRGCLDELELEHYHAQLKTCTAAAMDTVFLVNDLANDDSLFPGFWFSKYIAFNALSILYIYRLQIANGGVYPHPDTNSMLHGDRLSNPRNQRYLEAVGKAHHGLAEVSGETALAWRYSAILSKLRNAVEHAPDASPVCGSTYSEHPDVEGDLVQQTTIPAHDFDNRTDALLDWFINESVDDDLQFWPQLDSLPLCKTIFMAARN